MVQDDHRPKQPEAKKERERVREHVRVTLLKLTQRSRQASDSKKPD